MDMTLSATVVDGSLHPDAPLGLPDQSHVTLTIHSAAPYAVRSGLAWESMKRRIREQPLRSGGRKFTRDELHERN